MAATSKEPVIVSGFTLIPTKFHEDSESGHYLYVKEHSVRESDTCKPRDRTLFALNVPPYVNEACLRRIFSGCGKVENVFIHKKPTSAPPVNENTQFFKTIPPVTGFKVAYIVFTTPDAVAKAKATPFSDVKVLSPQSDPISSGMDKWRAEYAASILNPKDVQQEVDEYMAGYDTKKDEEKRKEKEESGQPDEDGWVTVTRHGKNKGVARTEAQERKVNNKEKKKRKEKELLQFYSYQIRESKRDHIAKLREQFEEDKNKISIMKAARKFKPY